MPRDTDYRCPDEEACVSVGHTPEGRPWMKLGCAGRSMSTEKRFYTETLNGSACLRDRQSPHSLRRDYTIDWIEDVTEGENHYLDELCDLLNRGHEAKERER